MEFQSFVNSTKNIIEMKCFYVFHFLLVLLILFLLGLFIKRPYVIMFKHVNFWKHIWLIHQKSIKNMLILKFHPGMKCLQVFFFFFFHPGMKSHFCLSSRDEISSRQKCLNSKRHLTIDRGDFIPGRVLGVFIPVWNFTRKHPLNRGNYGIQC